MTDLPDADLPDEPTIPARRTPRVDDALAGGSTVVVRRESRRREARRAAGAPPGPSWPPGAASAVPATPAPISTPHGRVAAAPDAAAGAVYGARVPVPVIASRTPPPARVAQARVDGDVTATLQRRAAVRRAVIVLLSASAVAVAAAAALLFVVFAS